MNENKAKKGIKKPKWMRYSWGDRLFLLFIYVFMALFTFCCAYPMYFTVIASVSGPNAVYRGECYWWVKEFTTLAYTEALKNRDIWIGYGNSILYTILNTLMSLALLFPCAYAMGSSKLWLKPQITIIFMFTMYFGGGLIPNYLLRRDLGLIDTRTVLWLSGMSISNMIVTRTFFKNNIPDSLLEAARIDGASEFYIFGRIVMPLSGSIVAVMTLYEAMGAWGGWFSAMIYTSRAEIAPLQLVLRRVLLMGEYAFRSGETSVLTEEEREIMEQREYLGTTMKYALIFVTSAPMIIMYPFIQKHFVKGMLVGSIKG